MATTRRLEQREVPDGMVANVPWGQPFERWSDRMIERGLTHLDETEGSVYFPHIFNSLAAHADARGLEV